MARKIDPAEWLVSRRNGWLLKHWPEIVRHCEAVLGPTGLDDLDPYDDYLGKGRWGPAYEISDEVVLKLTLDDTEAIMWRAIAATAKLLKHPGIARMIDTSYVPSAPLRVDERVRMLNPGKHTVYAIVRENVMPVEFDRRRIPKRRFAKMDDYLSLTCEAGQLAIGQWLDDERTDKFLPIFLDRCKELARGEMFPELRDVGQFMLDAWRSRKAKAILADVHIGNIGWPSRPRKGRGDQLVLYDVGLSQLAPHLIERYLRAIEANPA